MFIPYWDLQFHIFQSLGNIMVFSLDEVLAISLTVNICILIYCVILRIQKHFSSKCCCKNSSTLMVVCHVYETKPFILSKMVTEQLVICLIFILCLPALFGSSVIKYPFSGKLESPFNDYVRMLLAINIGKYVYMIAQDCFLLQKMDVSKWRTETIHHVVTMICYSIFLAYRQNLLLSIIGMTMEVSSTAAEFTKIMKETGKTMEKCYKEMSIFSCVITVVFRGVMPVIFLIIAMFHETPFVMEHAVLTVFFLTIIFFSVINVWLILSSVQRLVKSYCVKFHSCHNTDSSHSQFELSPPNRVQVGVQSFTKNNLGYLRRYDNKNLCNNFDEKLNTSKKNPTKEGFSASLFRRDDTQIQEQVLNDMVLTIDAEDERNAQPSEPYTYNEQNTPDHQEIVINNLRDSAESNSALIDVINDATTS